MQCAVSGKPVNNDAILANPTNTSPWYACDFCIHKMSALRYDIIPWKFFLHFWYFMRRIHRSQRDSPHKGSAIRSSDTVRLSVWRNNQSSDRWSKWSHSEHSRAYYVLHYGDVIMGAIGSHITSLTIGNSTVYSDADQRKHQNSASLAFVLGIHRWPMNSLHKGPVTRKMFPFDDVLMIKELNWMLLHVITRCWHPPASTHWDRDNMAAISQATLSNAFSLTKIFTEFCAPG